jgi:hypothetical protein
VRETAAFQKKGIRAIEESPVGLKKQVNVPLGNLLQALLKQVKATYLVKKDHLVIVPKK